ncbi:PREDICTED: protein FAR1-RELATED SEQUENCE 4-like [Prunus mume]|uniref:Protein FAR1-RELATED SEQUENCE 4-like n=1 Tax=Prunus mume TaxID=102107 RepID=A0ABM0NZS9_PRUMU|nr:PREDICTED: protein FAR1-RELATED SEQUENCE 4-like [Prunus mume]
MKGSGKMDRGVETSNDGCSDLGYLDGCERSSHRAPATKSGHMSIEHMDMYNKLDASRREILLDGDTEAALSYLKVKGVMDPELFCKFSVDEENRLDNLFWRDSTSLLDYIAYDDVLIFNSTYKTNVYDKPLVLFVGSNNYRSTVMFG